VSRPLRTRMHRIFTRPAPEGTRPPAEVLERPPDGWTPVDPSFGQRVADKADSLGFRMTDAAVRTIDRRTLLRRIGTLGAAAGLGAGRVLSGSNPSFAHEPMEAGCGPNTGGCGPSLLCKAIACNDSVDCKLSRAGVRTRADASSNHWPGVDCVGDDVHNCWTECCNGTLKRCCDCCVEPDDAFGTTSCGGCTGKKRCICRGPIGSC
jgi:hypothetical protein